MAETIGDMLPVPEAPESSPVSRITTRLNEWISRHTPKGREQEYLEKWSHVLEGIQGPAHYELEKKLATDATKYARNRVVRDMLVSVAVTGGIIAGAFGVRELHNRKWNLSGLFTDLGAHISNRTQDFVTRASKTATSWAMEGAQQAIIDNPHLVGEIVHTATQQASSALRQAATSEVVQQHLADVGTHAASAIADGAMAEVAARASALPAHTTASVLEWLVGLFPQAKHK